MHRTVHLFWPFYPQKAYFPLEDFKEIECCLAYLTSLLLWRCFERRLDDFVLSDSSLQKASRICGGSSTSLYVYLVLVVSFVANATKCSEEFVFLPFDGVTGFASREWRNSRNEPGLRSKSSWSASCQRHVHEDVCSMSAQCIFEYFFTWQVQHHFLNDTRHDWCNAAFWVMQQVLYYVVQRVSDHGGQLIGDQAVHGGIYLYSDHIFNNKAAALHKKNLFFHTWFTMGSVCRFARPDSLSSFNTTSHADKCTLSSTSVLAVSNNRSWEVCIEVLRLVIGRATSDFEQVDQVMQYTVGNIWQALCHGNRS